MDGAQLWIDAHVCYFPIASGCLACACQSHRWRECLAGVGDDFDGDIGGGFDDEAYRRTATRREKETTAHAVSIAAWELIGIVTIQFLCSSYLFRSCRT